MNVHAYIYLFSQPCKSVCLLEYLCLYVNICMLFLLFFLCPSLWYTQFLILVVTGEIILNYQRTRATVLEIKLLSVSKYVLETLISKLLQLIKHCAQNKHSISLLGSMEELFFCHVCPPLLILNQSDPVKQLLRLQ